MIIKNNDKDNNITYRWSDVMSPHVPGLSDCCKSRQM